MRHVIIRVGPTHCGPIPPGLLIVLPIDDVKPVIRHSSGGEFFERGCAVSFKNPIGRGYSFGEALHFVDMEVPNAESR